MDSSAVESLLCKLDVKACDAGAVASAISQLRRHFTARFASVAPPAASAPGAGAGAAVPRKRRREEESGGGEAWKPSFNAFLDALLLRVVAVRKSKRVSGDEMLQLHIDAFSTYGHFTTHALPIAAHAAQGAGGPMLSNEVLVRLVQTLLAGGGREAGGAYVGVGSEAEAGEGGEGEDAPQPVSASLLPYLTAELDTARATVRSEFADDYDDMRMGLLRSIREVARDRVAHPHGLLPAGAPVPADSAARAAALAAHPRVFGSNIVDLLLGISLPLTQGEWDEEGVGGRSSYASDTVGAELMAYAVAHSLDLGGWSPDADVDGPRESGGPGWAQYGEQKRAYSDAWLAALRCPLPSYVTRRVLMSLPTRLLPLFPGRTPLLLADFLGAAVAGGGPAALLAFEGLFALMQSHGLEFPRFYSTLYALLGSPSTAGARYKGRFFVLLDLFLSSPALPAYMVASFAKRALRVASSAGSPAFALLALGLTANLLVRHPRAMTPLMHRGAVMVPGAPAAVVAASPLSSWPSSADPFDAVTDEPAATHALDSSLWEVSALAAHYAAPVAHAARALAEAGAGSRAEVDIMEVAGEGGVGRDTSYAGMAKYELGRTVKVTAAAAAAGSGRPAWAAKGRGDAPAEPAPAVRVPVEVHWEHARQAGPLDGLAGGGAAAGVLAAACDFTR